MNNHYLTSLFTPRSVALFGASDRVDSVGGVVFKNLLSSGYKGKIYGINPKRETVQGEKAWASLDDIAAGDLDAIPYLKRFYLGDDGIEQRLLLALQLAGGLDVAALQAFVGCVDLVGTLVRPQLDQVGGRNRHVGKLV